MTWSYSSSKAFKRCQRQWFFSSIATNGKTRDPVRRRALFYGKLKTISAWRGHIVDKVIETYLVPTLNGDLGDRTPRLRIALDRARSLFDQQRVYAEQNRAETIDVTINKEGDAFALLFANEFGDGYTEEQFERAWSEIERSLQNLWQDETIKPILSDADRLMAQRAIHFPIADGLKGFAMPDLVAFKDDQPPVIIDWKVHAKTGNDARFQLATYAIALSRCTNPHRDFPFESEDPPETMRLIEAQLLLGQTHEYDLDEEDLDAIDAEIAASAYEMICLSEGKRYDDQNIDDFNYAFDGATCEACVFQRLCPEVANDA